MPAPPRAARIPWIVIVAVWTLPAVADVIDTYVSLILRGVAPSLRHVAPLVVPGWLVWAAMTPAIVWLGQALPLGRPVRAVPILAHVAASIVAACLHAAVIWATGRIFDPAEHMASGRLHYVDVLTNWAPISMLIFWAVVVAGYAYEAVRRSREQETRAAALAAELAQAQLAALRAQLHPHFLFNALNAAVSLVRLNERDAGVRVLTHLSDILRHMVRETTTHEVSLGEELALLERYLDIERTRFGTRLSVRIAVADELKVALVPALVLQPLVENAIRHGVEGRDGAGSVEIEASASGSTLALRVRDDGPGLPSGWRDDAPQGVGLRNTRARLSGLYSDRGQLRVTTRVTGGVEVEVTVPLRFAGDGHG